MADQNQTSNNGYMGQPPQQRQPVAGQPPPGMAPGYAVPPGQPQYAPPPGQQPPYGYAPPPGQPGYGIPPGQQQPYGYAPPGQVYPQPGQAPPPGGYPPPAPGGPQPQQQQWMVKPTGVPGCPPGLEYLTQIDQVLVQQTVELLEAFTGWETANRYVLRNSMGQQIFYAAEESDMCERQCCNARRGFVMHITDNMGQEVMRATRDFKCCAGAHCFAACDAFQMTLSVEAPPGQLIGTVRQDCSCLPPKYNVLDANETVVLQIEGPACMFFPQFCDQKFEVMTPNGQSIGDITKQFSGLIRELYTTADNFGVKFPMDLSVNMKAILLGAVFLIDFMYFETPQNQQ